MIERYGTDYEEQLPICHEHLLLSRDYLLCLQDNEIWHPWEYIEDEDDLNNEYDNSIALSSFTSVNFNADGSVKWYRMSDDEIAQYYKYDDLTAKELYYLFSESVDFFPDYFPLRSEIFYFYDSAYDIYLSFEEFFECVLDGPDFDQVLTFRFGSQI